MLIKEDIRKMINQEQYKKVLLLFKKECIEMTFNYVKKNNLINIEEDTDISDLLLIIPERYPNMYACMSIITSILYEENESVFDKLNYILDNYDYINKMLT